MSNLTLEALLDEVTSYLETSDKVTDLLPFSVNVKEILKRIDTSSSNTHLEAIIHIKN